MRSKFPSQTVIHSVLRKLGFAGRRVLDANPPYWLFTHPPSGSMFFFPLKMKAESVRQRHWIDVKHTLDWNGVMEPDDLERFMEKCRRGSRKNSGQRPRQKSVARTK